VFATNEVEYLVVGGYAVRHHGHLRPAKDLDVLVSNSSLNSIRLCAALIELIGIDHPNLRPQQIEGRKRQINLTEWGHNFEVLTAADGVDFPAAYARRIMASVGGQLVPVIDKADLLAMKRRSSRSQDTEDVKALEAV
jgi:hypothetical protein